MDCWDRVKFVYVRSFVGEIAFGRTNKNALHTTTDAQARLLMLYESGRARFKAWNLLVARKQCLEPSVKSLLEAISSAGIAVGGIG